MMKAEAVELQSTASGHRSSRRLKLGLESAQGSQVPHGGGRLAKTEGLGNFLIRKLLEVTHEQYLTILLA